MSLDTVDVVVIIVTYKSAQLTVDCLDSIAIERANSQFGVRVVVVDNASGDEPFIADAIALKGWSPWVRMIAAPQNGGFAYGNNLGIEAAYATRRPRYVHLLNPDTQLRPRAIESLVRFLEQNTLVGIAGSSFENLDGTEWPIAFRFPSILSELDAGLEVGFVTRMLRRWVVAKRMSRVAQPIDWVAGASMMVRSEVLDAIGGLDENYFLYFEETDFCYRARRAGFMTWYVPDSRVMHIAGQSTKVTERDSATKRLPSYWFESRRRYFATTHGTPYAAVVDIVAVLAYSIGLAKRIALGRRRQGIPHFIRDLVSHSALRPKNWPCPEFRSFHPNG